MSILPPQINISREFMDNFSPTVWAWNGVRVLSETLQRHCNVTWPLEMTHERCGFKVYDHSFFIPIKVYTDAFSTDQAKIEKVMKTLDYDDSTVYHFSNNASKNIKLAVSKPVAYTLLAQKFCPRVFANAKVLF